MKKLDERSQWENEWADAFNDAKQSPSERVWQNIDSVLANKEARKYKKRAIFYKWMAAASVFISACGAVLFMLSNPQDTSSRNIAENSGTQQQQHTEQATPEAPVVSPGANTAFNEQPAAEEHNTPAAEPAASEKNTPAESASDVAGAAIAANKNHAGTGTAEDGKHSAGTNVPGNGKSGKNAASAENQLAGTQEQAKAFAPEGQEDMESGSSRSFAFADEGEKRKSGGEKSSSPAGGASAGINSAEEAEEASAPVVNPSYSSGIALLKAEKRGLMQEDHKPDLIEVYVSKVWMPTDLLKNKPGQDTERFWVGASVASNNFKPNFEDNSPSPVMLAENNFKPDVRSRLSEVNMDSWDKSQESMVSFAGGLQAAARLGEKWVLQGGLQYGTYKTSGNAGAYSDATGTHTYPLHYSNFSPEKLSGASNSLDAGNNLSDNVVMNTSPVSAINTFEFLSVPVTIGYMVLDKKVGVVLAPGVTSEFFLSNQLTDKKEELGDYSVSGSDSPYNIIHFRGLVGASIFYKLGDHYVISIEPSYQHAITDFNKSGSVFDSRPSNLSLGAAFKYIIR